MVSLSLAEGEKRRLGGRLLLAAVAPAVDASIPALLLKLPVRSPAVSGPYCCPMSFGILSPVVVVSIA